MLRLGLVAVLTFLLDQLSKHYVLEILGLRILGGINVYPPYLTFRMGWNRGVNFGLLADDSPVQRWILIGLALVVSVGVIIWTLKQARRGWMLVWAGLLVGGALGNALDRVLYGAVADFLNMSCCGIANPFVFNIADVGIFLGALGLVWGGGAQKTP